MRLVTALCAPAALLLLVCCSALPDKAAPTEKELVIPEFPTAKEQYQFAKMYQQSQVISGQQSRRNVQMDKVMQCFDRVVKKFPDDHTYTPLSKLEIGDCYANQGESRQALAIYEEVTESYAQEEYLRARAKMSTARLYDKDGRFQEAKDVYREIMNEFGESKSATVRELVKRAQAAYIQVREQPKSKSRKLLGR